MNSIVPDTWKIPPQLAARFGDNAGRQRAMNAEGHLPVSYTHLDVYKRQPNRCQILLFQT